MITEKSPAHGVGPSRACRISALLPSGVLLLLCFHWPAVAGGRALAVAWPWIPSLDLYLSFRLDGLSLMFGLMVCVVAVLVTLYSASYMAGHPQMGRYLFFLHGFMLSMLGIVTADNLLLLFVFWEGTTFFSYFLIGFDHTSTQARDHARQALLVTGAGGLALLIALLLIKIAGGSYSLSQWMTPGNGLQHHRFYFWILILVLLGAFTKSAQFPFHFWLPNAMSAPTPVSAFLHAATMVKAGIYLLMRVHPLLGGTTVWMCTLVVVGGVTALWSALQAFGPQDLKRVLAYTTTMALGMMTMFLGGQSAPVLTAATTFVLVHALYKAALFLAVGIIDHAAGTRQLDRLGGLRHAMPLTTLAVAAAACSMAGFPLFFGFIGKEIMYKGALAEEMFPQFATMVAVAANALMTAVAAIVLLGPFSGQRRPELSQAHDPPWTMWIGPAILGILGVVFGIMPGWVSKYLVEPAVWAYHPTYEEVRLALFHGINTPLLLSALTLSLGAFFYSQRHRIGALVQSIGQGLPVSTAGLFDHGLSGFLTAAKVITGKVQSGVLHTYLSITLITVCAGMAWSWMRSPPDAGTLGVWTRIPPPGHWMALGLMAVIAISTGMVLVAKRRLMAIGGLGGVGAGAALIFVVFGAPDIALTQLLVETLTLIIISLVLLRLPPLEAAARRRAFRRAIDAFVALVAGALVTALLLGVLNSPLDRSLTAFYETQSYVAAHGRNIVNVILVDFRALDTLGEITVVVLAAWASVALIRNKGGPS